MSDQTTIPATAVDAAKQAAIEAFDNYYLDQNVPLNGSLDAAFDALISALAPLAAPAGDVAGLVARLRAGEPCHPPCKGMDARSGCICAETADGLMALEAERDEARYRADLARHQCVEAGKIANGLTVAFEQVEAERDEARRERDAAYEHGIKVDRAVAALVDERDALAERLRSLTADAIATVDVWTRTVRQPPWKGKRPHPITKAVRAILNLTGANADG